MREQLIDAGRGMRPDAEQHVCQVLDRVDIEDEVHRLLPASRYLKASRVAARGHKLLRAEDVMGAGLEEYTVII